MVVPDLFQSLEQHLALLTLLHRVLSDARWERWDDVLLRELVEVLRDELGGAFVQLVAVLVQDHVVRIPMVLLKGQVRSVVILDLDDVPRELRPGLVHRDVWSMLR